MEKWKIIEDYPNYAISNYGRCKNTLSNYILKERRMNKHRLNNRYLDYIT